MEEQQQEEVDAKTQIIHAIFNKTDYKTNIKKVIEAITAGDDELLSIVIEAVLTVLTFQDEFSPETKLYSIRAVKDLMSLRQENVINKVSEELLPFYLEIAQYKCEDRDDDRGKTIFGDDPENFVIGNSFFRLILECIYVWAVWFPKTFYDEAYQALVDNQVAFPKKMSYFKPEDIETSPKSITPKKVQQEKVLQEKTNERNQVTHESFRDNPPQQRDPSFGPPSQHSRNEKEPSFGKQPSHNTNRQDSSHRENVPLNSEGNHQKAEILTQEIQISCQNLENLQECLTALLSHEDEQEIKEDLAEIMENFKKVKEKHQNLCQEVSDFNDQKIQEAFLGKLMDEIEVIETILEEYQKLRTGRIPYKAFRSEFSNIEGTKGETPGPQHQDEFLKHQGEHNNREEEIHSRVESIHSMSIMRMNDPFDEKVFEKEVFTNIKSFNDQRRKYLIFAKSDALDIIMRIVECCNGIMVRQTEPIRKVLAMRFIKEGMDKKNPPFIHAVSTIILDTIANVASFNCKSKERSRGKEFFGKNTTLAPDNEKLGLTYFLLALESILIWARWLPKEQPNSDRPSRFLRKYEELLDLGVVFPDSLTYFKDLIYEAEVIEKDFMKLKNSFSEVLSPKESDCNQKNLLGLIKDIALRLNSEKIVDIMMKFQEKIRQKKNGNDKPDLHDKKAKLHIDESERSLFEHKLHFERLDQDLKFFKKILIEFENYHSNSLSYVDFREEFMEIFIEKHLIHIKHIQTLIEMAPEPQEALFNMVEDEEEIEHHAEILHKYRHNPMTLLVESFRDFNALKDLMHTLNDIFSERRNYTIKFEALLLLKHAMDIRHPEFAMWVESECLDCLNSNFISSDLPRNDRYFEDFKRLHQECILIWSLWYPEVHGKASKFTRTMEEFYERAQPLDDLIYFDKISYDEFERNKLSEHCYFHRNLEESLEFFAFLKGEFLGSLEDALHNHHFQEHIIENFFHVFEDVCRHQENFHSNETEDNVAFFQNSLRHFEIYQKHEHRDPKAQEMFIKSILHAENMYQNQESLQLSPGTSIQKSFLHDSNYFNENDENKVRPSIASMNYNPSFLKTEHKHLPHKSFHEEEYQVEAYNEEEEKHNGMEHHHHVEENQYEEHHNHQEEDYYQEEHHHEELHHIEQHHQEHEVEQHEYGGHNVFGDHSDIHEENFEAQPFEHSVHSQNNKHHLELQARNDFQEEEGRQSFHELSHNFEEAQHKQNSHRSGSHHSMNSQNLQKIMENIDEREPILPTIGRQNNEQNEENEKLKNMNLKLENAVSDLQDQNEALFGQIRNLENQIENKEREIFNLNTELESKDKEIRDLKREIEDLKQNPYKQEAPRAQATDFSQIQVKSLYGESPLRLETTEKKALALASPEKEDSVESPYLLNAEDIPLEKEIIFPFKSNLEYFSVKTAKQYKGQLVMEDNQLFKEIEQSFQDIKKFKLGCLKQKQLVHKGNDVHIGVVTNMQSHQGKNYLRLGSFITNVSGGVLKNLDYELSNDENFTLWSKASNYNQELSIGGQRKLDVILSYNETPYKILKMNVKTQTENPVVQETSIFMPTTINKFMKWGNCDTQQFNEMWTKANSRRNAVPYKTKTKKLNLKIVRSFSDLKTFFQQMVEVSDVNNKDESNLGNKKRGSLGGVFQLLNSRTEFLIKFTVNLQEQTFMVRMIEYTEEEAATKLKEFILRTFMFLLGSNEIK